MLLLVLTYIFLSDNIISFFLSLINIMERNRTHDYEDPYNLAEDSMRPPKGGGNKIEPVDIKTASVREEVKKAIPPTTFKRIALKEHGELKHNPIHARDAKQGDKTHMGWVNSVVPQVKTRDDKSGTQKAPGAWLEEWNQEMVMRPGDIRTIDNEGRPIAFRPTGEKDENHQQKVDTVPLIDEDELKRKPHLARILSIFAAQDRAELESNAHLSEKLPYDAPYESVWAKEAKATKAKQKPRKRSAARQMAGRAYDYVAAKASSAGTTVADALGAAARSVGSAISSGYKSAKNWLGGLFGRRKDKHERPAVQEG
jgi:hypothetical protein